MMTKMLGRARRVPRASEARRIPGDCAWDSSVQLPSSPQISHGSQHPQFSNHHRFPSFLRTVPSSAHQPWLLNHFNWSWVGWVGSDNGNFEQLQVLIQAQGSCVAFLSRISSPDSSVHGTATRIASMPTYWVIICDCYHFQF